MNKREEKLMEHKSVKRRANNPTICSKAKGSVAYVNSLLYPCCIAPAFFGGTGIPLSENWREEILSIPMPCDNCFFAVEKEFTTQL